MSLERVRTFTRQLPPRLREDVLGYARSVETALPDIFDEAGVEMTVALGDQLVFIAGVKKLHAVCTSAFWTLDNSLAALRQSDIEQVRLGGWRISRGSRDWLRLREVAVAIDALLSQHDILRLVSTASYAQILLELVDER